MATFLIISSCLLWIVSLVLLPSRPIFSPLLSYIGLFLISLARHQGFQIIPVNSVILITWACMTILVMLITMMQPEEYRNSRKGMGYITFGAVTGMAVGLLGFTVTTNISLLYGIMVAATVAGLFFGFLMYTKTPKGSGFTLGAPGSFSYLLAKGFPAAITVMQMGIVAVIALAVYNS